jgi:hypothetical protein
MKRTEDGKPVRNRRAARHLQKSGTRRLFPHNSSQEFFGNLRNHAESKSRTEQDFALYLHGQRHVFPNSSEGPEMASTPAASTISPPGEMVPSEAHRAKEGGMGCSRLRTRRRHWGQFGDKFAPMDLQPGSTRADRRKKISRVIVGSVTVRIYHGINQVAGRDCLGIANYYPAANRRHNRTVWRPKRWHGI